MTKKLIILFAMAGVCSLIAANYYSNQAGQAANAAASQQQAAAPNSAPAPTPAIATSSFDVEAVTKAAREKPIKPSVPKGAVDVSPVIYGDMNAPIVIEEFASYTCSHCAGFHRETLPQIKIALIETGLAQLHVYSFVRNAQDLEATMLVQCQQDNAARSNFHNAILNSQEQWSLSSNYQEGLKTIARVGGYSDEAYVTCVNDEALQEKIIASRQWFDKQVGVNATPYFRVGSEIVKGTQNVEAFSQAIEAELKK